MKITFVVLHYENINDTKECIDSLLAYYSNEGMHIVIVDNGSVKNNLDSLTNDYFKYDRLHFLKSETNLGFTKGNNLGFYYAKYELNSEVIILTNNDTIFSQESFYELLEREVTNKHFDVAGPKIISTIDGNNQNPVPKMYTNKKAVRKRILKFQLLLILNHFGADVYFKTIYHKGSQVETIENEVIDKDNFQLHGSCMIFSNDYVKEMDGLYEGTFMYGEESILKYIVEKNNYQMEYLADLIVYHKEGSSTNNFFGKGKKKRRFFYKHNIVGCKILLDLMNNK